MLQDQSGTASTALPSASQSHLLPVGSVLENQAVREDFKSALGTYPMACLLDG